MTEREDGGGVVNEVSCGEEESIVGTSFWSWVRERTMGSDAQWIKTRRCVKCQEGKQRPNHGQQEFSPF